MEQINCDVLIVGAGMVGASLAIGLAAQQRKVVIVDAAPLNPADPVYSPSFDARSTALSKGSTGILGELGVWQQIKQHSTAIKTVHVSEKGRMGTSRIDADALGLDSVGSVVQNKWLGHCLLSQFADDETVRLVQASHVTQLKPSGCGFGAAVKSNNGDTNTCTVEAKLCIIADGAQSSTAKMVGIDFSSEAYGQHAIIANLQTSLKNQGVAYERFLPDGPIAMLPLSEDVSSLIWTVPERNAEQFLTLSEAEFGHAVSERFGNRLGSIVKVGTRNSYPLRLTTANEQIRPGLVLLGNAAHSLHPVAGQGFNLALRGVALLLEKLKNYQWNASSSQAFDALKAYYDEQRMDQTKTITFSDQLVRVFGSDSSLLGLAREAGLVGLDLFPELKNVFASHAMGMGNRRANIKLPLGIGS